MGRINMLLSPETERNLKVFMATQGHSSYDLAINELLQKVKAYGYEYLTTEQIVQIETQKSLDKLKED